MKKVKRCDSTASKLSTLCYIYIILMVLINHIGMILCDKHGKKCKGDMKTKFAIGCLVQWYECDIIEEYVDSLKDAIDAYDGEVVVDFTIITNEDLEKCITR